MEPSTSGDIFGSLLKTSKFESPWVFKISINSLLYAYLRNC